MMPDTKVGLCDTCRELKPVAWTDPIGREYCPDCFMYLPVPTAARLMEHLARTIPFQVGDTVEARTAGALFDGVGTIDEISIDPEKFGTPVYPSFHVVFHTKAYPDAPDDRWYCEAQLKKQAGDE